MNNSEIKSAVKNFILQEFLPGEDPAVLSESTPLLTVGLLDSIATLRLVSFLEERFAVTLTPEETDAERLDTIERIATLVGAKLNSA